MPRGGARKGAGRKPKPLAEKLDTGNPGHRPLKKLEFQEPDGDIEQDFSPPDYLGLLERQRVAPGTPTPIEIYHATIKHLKPSGCLSLVSPALLADYVMAKYYLICSQFDLSMTAIVAVKAQGEKGKNRDEYEMTSFAEAYLKLQKNVLQTWEPIWEIVQANATRLVTNPEQDLVTSLTTARQRKTQKGA